MPTVFAHHTNYQNINTGAPGIATTMNETEQDLVGMEQQLPALDSSSGFSWGGNVSSLADIGLTDASQLWLWADNLSYQSFAELSEILS